MPTIFGQKVSDHTYELNKHMLNPPKEPETQARKAVTMWHTEREYMAAVFQAAAWEALREPAFSMLLHIPNENSHKTPGVKGGVPDLFLATPRGGKAGLFIELKIASGKPSQKQLDVIYELRTAGYECHVIWDSVDEVINTIYKYLQA